MAKNGKSNGKSKGARRSKAECSTGAKENKVEMRKAKDLDLPEPVVLQSDDFQMHYRAIKAATEKKDTAVNLLRGCYKQAKKVHPQLAEAVRWAIGIERADDPEAVKAELAMRGFVLKETGHHVQLTIHDSLLGDVNEAAELRGYKDAKASRVAGAVYPEGSDLHGLYMKGWTRGTAENLGIQTDDIDDLLLAQDEAGDNGARQLREEAAVN